MSLKILNPYLQDRVPWLKGNLHCHTTNSDGERPPQGVVDAYAQRGYDFLMLSDHDTLTEPASVDARGMALLAGNEVTLNGPHILHVGAREVVDPLPDRQRVLDRIAASTGFAIINHPNWERFYDHCPQDRLNAWRGYTGLEIYNGVVRRQRGTPLATDRWDRLLGDGRRVWGFANDDSHRPIDDGVAWNVVQCASREPGAILEALQRGRFYASTGVTIREIDVEQNRIHVRTENAQRIIVFSAYGHREAAVDGGEIHFEVTPTVEGGYGRFECWGAGEAMAWTQPFFLERT
ncbi:MAG: PHP domain-containing protein [Candidatus Hydrogenedentes bacterium]|nr:PHP domain-containing protein [Candidatus Hydrogenedentota bacterium]